MPKTDVLVVANWKNNTRLADANVLATGVMTRLEDLEGLEVVLCPPLPWLTTVHEVIAGLPHIKAGVQNISGEPTGPYTGEVAAALLKGVASYAIIGHSEQVELYHESAERLGLRVKAALASGIIPIVCVGEERRSSGSAGVVGRRLAAILKSLTHAEKGKVVVAFEPVWAISKGKQPKQAASPEYVNDIAKACRGIIPTTARILYGGSVTAANVAEYVAQPEIAGVLVGGASLQLREFITLLKNAASAGKE